MRNRKPSFSRRLLLWSGAALLAALLFAAVLAVDSPTASVIAQDEYPPLAVLPPVPIPADNPITPEKLELGRMLFFDPRMSADGSLSCNSCHPSDAGWGVRTPISFGGPGTSHWRNSPTLLNIGYYTKLNWDGAKKSIEKQNSGAWGGAVAGNLDKALGEERLAQIPEYVERFNAVYGTDYPHFDDALAAATSPTWRVASN